QDGLYPVPNEEISLNEIRRISPLVYGMMTWGNYFTSRQSLALMTLVRLLHDRFSTMQSEEQNEEDPGLIAAVQTCLALTISKASDLANSLCRWEPVAQCPRQLFARQAIAMSWDYAEGVTTGDSSGSFWVLVDRFVQVLDEIGSDWLVATPQQSSA